MLRCLLAFLADVAPASVPPAHPAARPERRDVPAILLPVASDSDLPHALYRAPHLAIQTHGRVVHAMSGLTAMGVHDTIAQIESRCQHGTNHAVAALKTKA